MPKTSARPRVNKTGAAVDGILALLIERRLKPGDRLPPEAEMARLFGISRVSLREGLQGLKFLGLLEASPRRGTRLRDVDYALLGRVIGFQLVVAGPSRGQLSDARFFVELGALELAFERATPRDLARLRELSDCSRKDNSPAAVRRHLQADCRFHQKLLRIGGNEVLAAFARTLEMFFTDVQGPPADSRRAAREHRRIAEALASGNRELARGILRAHLARRVEE